VRTTTHIIRSLFALGIAQMLTWLGSGLMTVLLPRYLGDVNLGRLTFAFALTNLTGLLADLGVTMYLTREVARDPSSANRLTVNLMLMRVPLSIALAAATMVFARLAAYDPVTQQLVDVLSLGIVVVALSSVVTGTLQGLHQMKTIAVTSVVTKVGYALVAAAFLLLGAGALAVSISWVLVGILGLVYSSATLVRHVRLTPSIDVRIWRGLLVAGLPFFVWQAALLVYGQIDTVMLGIITTDAVVGWYGVAYRLVMIPVFIPTIVVTVIYPALSASMSDARSFAALARRGLHVIALVSTPMALGIMLLPNQIIHLLGYPASFENSVVPLVLLAPHLPLAAVDVMIGTVLNARDRQRQWAMTGVAAAILNPLLNLAAIPYAQAQWGNGAIGAAAITTFTEVFMLIGGLRLLPSGVFGRSTLTGIGKVLVASASMGVAVWFTRDLPIAVPVAVGATVYSVTCLLTGAVSIGELKEVHLHLVRGRAPSQVPT
jgi:O-antigen/teichoic acid export membrane protein